MYLKWDTVPDIDMAGIRRGYTITYRKTKDVGEHVHADEKQISVFDPEQTEIVIGGLEYYCEYSFVIRVFNTWFYGDDSEPVYGGELNLFSMIRWYHRCSYVCIVETCNPISSGPLKQWVTKQRVVSFSFILSYYYTDFKLIGASCM